MLVCSKAKFKALSLAKKKKKFKALNAIDFFVVLQICKDRSIFKLKSSHHITMKGLEARG